MLRIGDFSKLAQVPVATLRYYDQLGLLKPARVDQFTEYRYYDVEQLPRLNRILALKDLGFSLDQIERLLDDNISVKELRAMLLLRQADAEREVAEVQARLTRVASRLREIEEEGKPSSYDIVTKSAAPQWLASTRQLVAHADEMHELCWTLHDRLRAWSAAEGIKPLPPPAPQLLNLYYNTEYTETDLDLEAAIVIAAPPRNSRKARDDTSPVTLRELPGEPLVASGMLRGSMEEALPLIRSLITWVSVNEYEATGPLREVHHTPREAEVRIVEMELPIRPNNN
jgi:DNA-binding transcriptional MerR regulator/effector-binding domain-containing protein